MLQREGKCQRQHQRQEPAPVALPAYTSDSAVDSLEQTNNSHPFCDMELAATADHLLRSPLPELDNTELEDCDDPPPDQVDWSQGRWDEFHHDAPKHPGEQNAGWYKHQPLTLGHRKARVTNSTEGIELLVIPDAFSEVSRYLIGLANPLHSPYRLNFVAWSPHQLS